MSENLGFLTVSGNPSTGLTGGFLVLNRAGRPLEFHCTMPLLPDRIQQILYGDALQPFLCGEKIAQTLLQRSKLPVLSVFTNLTDVLPVQSAVSIPIIYVFDELTKPETDATSDSPPIVAISEELSESLKDFGIDNTNFRLASADTNELSSMPRVTGLDTGDWKEVRIGNRRIAVPEIGSASREELAVAIKRFARTIDVLEPFARIRRALDEARNAA